MESVQNAAGVPVGSDEYDSGLTLFELWDAIKRHLVAVIVVSLLGAAVAAAGTITLIPSKYTSSTLMLVLTKETTLQSLADLQIGSQLTNDYKILIMSKPVLDMVIGNLGLDMDYHELEDEIDVTNQNDTRILRIAVTDTDPQRAKQIVDELASVSSDYIADQMEITAPKIIEAGEVPTTRTSPSLRTNTAVGLLAGLFISIAVVAISEIRNDAVVTEADVEQYLGLITLASVPMREVKGRRGSRESRRDRKAREKRERESRRMAKSSWGSDGGNPSMVGQQSFTGTHFRS